MTDRPVPEVGHSSERPAAPEAIGLYGGYVTVGFDTSDAGADPMQAVEWVAAWVKKALAEAPFHVEGFRAEYVSYTEAFDV